MDKLKLVPETSPLVPEDETLTAGDRQDCPVCMLPIPFEKMRSIYSSCCGNVICKGCITKAAMHQGERKAIVKVKNAPCAFALQTTPPCAFCRSDKPKDDQERVLWFRRRADPPYNDPIAMILLGNAYVNGRYGLPKDPQKAFGFYECAAQVGSSDGFYELAVEHDPDYADSVVTNMNKEDKLRMYRMCLEKAAKGGHLLARLKLSRLYFDAGDKELAAHHAMVAACAGHNIALDDVKQYFMQGCISKTDFAKSLRLHQAANDERKSKDREFALLCGSMHMPRNL